MIPDDAAPEGAAPGTPPARRHWLLAASVLCLASLAAYSNTFSSPFHFDDGLAIVDNPTIRSIFPLHLTTPEELGGITVDGRPFLNFTLALNYLVGGLDVTSYHVANFLIHLLNALLLFELVRRLCLTGPLRERYGDKALKLAFATALLWALHPLQTQAVTYVVQRAESLAATFYLFALLGLVSSEGARRGFLFLCGSVAACFLGAATKEVVATAPLALYGIDAVFLSGSWRAPLKRRPLYYAAAASSWLFLAWLIASTGARGNTVGFSLTFGWQEYLATQFYAVVRYLRLSFWPSGLIFDYGPRLVDDPFVVLPSLAFVSAAVFAAAAGLFRRKPAALVGSLFFLILAPTSSFVPIEVTIAEYRMYLPLAAVTCLAVFAADRLWSRCGPSAGWAARGVPLAALAVAALTLAGATWSRNELYKSPYDLWADTLRKAPWNFRAMMNFANESYFAGRHDEALRHYRIARNEMEGLRRKAQEAAAAGEDSTQAMELISTRLAEVSFSIGMTQEAMGRPEEAILSYEEAIRLDPIPGVHNNLANLFAGRGELDRAIALYRRAIEIQPDFFPAHYNLANAYFEKGMYDEAVRSLDRALEIDPGHAPSWSNRGSALLAAGRFDEAGESFRRCLELDLGYLPARKGLEEAENLRKRAAGLKKESAAN